MNFFFKKKKLEQVNYYEQEVNIFSGGVVLDHRRNNSRINRSRVKIRVYGINTWSLHSMGQRKTPGDGSGLVNTQPILIISHIYTQIYKFLNFNDNCCHFFRIKYIVSLKIFISLPNYVKGNQNFN